MSQMIELMESRVLLTASAPVIEGDLSAGAAAITESKADLKLALTGVSLDVKGFKADLKGLKLTATQKSAVATVEKAVTVDTAKLNALVGKILTSGYADGLKLEATLKSLKAHPTSTAIEGKVGAALGKLEGVFSTTVISNAESTLSADVSTVDADLDAAAAAVPSTQSTVSSTESGLAEDETTLSVDATTIDSAITALATDLA